MQLSQISPARILLQRHWQSHFIPAMNQICMSKPRALNLDLWLCYWLHKPSTTTWVAGLKSAVWERMWVCQLQWKPVHLALLLIPGKELELGWDTHTAHGTVPAVFWKNWVTQLFLFWFFSSLQSFLGSPEELSFHILPTDPAGRSHLHFTPGFYLAATVP